MLLWIRPGVDMSHSGVSVLVSPRKRGCGHDVHEFGLQHNEDMQSGRTGHPESSTAGHSRNTEMSGTEGLSSWVSLRSPNCRKALGVCSRIFYDGWEGAADHTYTSGFVPQRKVLAVRAAGFSVMIRRRFPFPTRRERRFHSKSSFISKREVSDVAQQGY